MMLSTILSPYVLEYFCKSLNMYNFICLYKKPIDCPNIIQIVAKIKDLKEFDELVFFIPIASVVSIILRTMVFVNSLDKRVTLANYLHNLPFTYVKKNRKRLTQIFNSILEPNTKTQYLKNFYNNDTRIWIYIDTAGIRIDIGNIVLIVQ